jgi:hypothetical protein
LVWHNDPLLGGTHPYAPLQLNPIGIIESANHNQADTRLALLSGHEGCSAAATEMKPKPPISVVYSVVVGCNPITGYFNILFVKPCDHAERTAGKALAKCTVAYVSTNRFALYAVSDRSTHTPSAMNLGHFHPLRLIELPD